MKKKLKCNVQADTSKLDKALLKARGRFNEETLNAYALLKERSPIPFLASVMGNAGLRKRIALCLKESIRKAEENKKSKFLQNTPK